MTIRVAPAAGLAPTQPSVGIFWRVTGVLVVDRSILDEGEPYGDCITHAAGHYERWEDWKALGAEQLRASGFPDRIASTEYDEWPHRLQNTGTAFRALRGPAFADAQCH
jgi:hypothetical protein